MSADVNKVLVHQYYDALWNRGDMTVIDTVTTSDYFYDLAGNPTPMDHAGLQQFAGMLRSAFPDWHVTSEDLIGEGDRVAVRWSAAGTHQGPYQGIPATGKQVTVNGMTLLRFADEKIAEERVIIDMLSALQQLGAIPAPGQPGG